MKNITTDNIFEDIGFDKQEAANMKVRAELLLEIREYIRKKGLKQKDAACLVGDQSTGSQCTDGRSYIQVQY